MDSARSDDSTAHLSIGILKIMQYLLLGFAVSK
jgi:hypothetical protein